MVAENLEEPQITTRRVYVVYVVQISGGVG